MQNNLYSISRYGYIKQQNKWKELLLIVYQLKNEAIMSKIKQSSAWTQND